MELIKYRLKIMAIKMGKGIKSGGEICLGFSINDGWPRKCWGKMNKEIL
jgi:hypothetical protein